MSDTLGYVVLDGQPVAVACVAGSTLVFGSGSPPHFELPRWIPDDDVASCRCCSATFTILRRRHHCRACGNVFCDKCCRSEMPLPQYCYSACEKVCEHCAPAAALLAKVASSLPYQRLEASKGLCDLAKEASSLPKFLQQGGLQGLVYLAGDSNFQTKSVAMAGLVTLSSYDQLLGHLANAGCINAVCSVLNGKALDDNIVFNSMTVLIALCHQQVLKQRVIMEGALPAVGGMLSSGSHRALLSLSVLSLLTEDPSLHSCIMKDPTALSSVLSLTVNEEMQVKHYAFRILANLAATSQENGLMILQNDFLKGQNIIKAFQVYNDDVTLLKNAILLVGNMAFHIEKQEALRPYLEHVLDLLNNWPKTAELLTEVVRTVANFCIRKDNVSLLVARLPQLVNQCLCTEDDAIRYQCLRAVFYLLGHSTPDVIAGLTSEGCSSVLSNLARMPGALAAIQKIVAALAPGLGVTLTRPG